MNEFICKSKIFIETSILFLDTLDKLKNVALERFLTTPLEEREKVEQTTNLNARLVSNESTIAKLEKELNEAIAERDTEVSLTNMIGNRVKELMYSPLRFPLSFEYHRTFDCLRHLLIMLITDDGLLSFD